MAVRVELDDCSGNPVQRYSGNKIEPELDFTGGGEMGLSLVRTYNHAATRFDDAFGTATIGGIFGNHWRSSFDASIEVVSGYTSLWAWRPDGRRVEFALKANSGLGRYEEVKNGKLNPKTYAIVTDGSMGGWNATVELHFENGEIEVYKYRLIKLNPTNGQFAYGGGPIARRINANGVAWNYVYSGVDGWELTKVEHSSGRSVQFGWSGGRVTQVTDPAGSVYQYAYNANGHLASATLPGSPATTITYHYENGQYPGALTGKSYNGVRYSSFAYDGNGRAVSTEHAGGVERHSFNYAGDMQGWWNVTETNPLGRVIVHTYDKGKKVSVSGNQSPNCPAASKAISYDSNGNKDIATDFAGVKTNYDYDEHGHLLAQVEGYETPFARVTRHVWDENKNRVVETTIDGISKTTYAYIDNGRPARMDVRDLSTGQTRTTTYAYTFHGNGLPASIVVDAPSPDEDATYTYGAAGDLLQVSDAAGQATTYSNHDALGRPSRVTGPTGAITDYGYDARGRVTLVRTYLSGSAVDTRYVYGASGLLDEVQTSDGNNVLYHYDDARRLIQEDVTAPGGGYEVRRTFYNAMSQPTRVEFGRDN